MEQERKQELEQKMTSIANLIEQGTDANQTSVDTVIYYNNFEFKGSGFAEYNIFVAKVQNSKENSTTYEIYSENSNSLIATVNEQGKIHFMPEYIEKLRESYGEHFENLMLEDLNFELPKELQKEDIVLTKEERARSKAEKELTHSKNGKSIDEGQKNQGEKEQQESEEENEEENEEDQKKEKGDEESEKEEIATKKGIPSHSILFIKENSNFYKDHPQLEPNLYFYRDNSGVIKAEYLDENRKPQPSKFFEDSRNSFKTRNC